MRGSYKILKQWLREWPAGILLFLGIWLGIAGFCLTVSILTADWPKGLSSWLSALAFTASWPIHLFATWLFSFEALRKHSHFPEPSRIHWPSTLTALAITFWPALPALISYTANKWETVAKLSAWEYEIPLVVAGLFLIYMALTMKNPLSNNR